MEAQEHRKWAGLVGILAGLVAIAAGFFAHFNAPVLGHPWRPFITFLEDTAVFSAVGLLIGMGVIMIIGGLLAFRSALWGGLLVLFPSVVGLIYCYTHEWHRLDLLKIWALPVVLGWLAGILAGYALGKDVKAYDGPPESEVSASPGAPPSVTPG